MCDFQLPNQSSLEQSNKKSIKKLQRKTTKKKDADEETEMLKEDFIEEIICKDE